MEFKGLAEERYGTDLTIVPMVSGGVIRLKPKSTDKKKSGARVAPTEKMHGLRLHVTSFKLAFAETESSKSWHPLWERIRDCACSCLKKSQKRV